MLDHAGSNPLRQNEIYHLGSLGTPCLVLNVCVLGPIFRAILEGYDVVIQSYG